MFRIVAILAGLLAVSFNSPAKADEGTSGEVLVASLAIPIPVQTEVEPEPFEPLAPRWFTWTGVLFFPQGQTEPVAFLVEWKEDWGKRGIAAVTEEDFLLGYPLRGQCNLGRCEFIIPEGMSGLYTSFVTTVNKVVLRMNTDGFNCTVEVPAVRTIIGRELGGHLYKPSMRDATSTGPEAAVCDLRRPASR